MTTPWRAGPGLVVLICVLVAALDGYDVQAFGVAAPAMAPALGLDPAQVGWAASLAMVGLVVGAFAGGLIADRVGRKPVLIAATAAFGVFSLATAASHSFEALALARFATFLGFGGAMPNLIAIANEVSRPGRRTGTVTLMTCGFPAGGASVALLARLGGEALDWRTLFMVGGVLPLILVPAVWLLLPETRPVAEGRPAEGAARALLGGRRWAVSGLLWLAAGLALVILFLALNWLPTLVVAKGRPPSEAFVASMVFNLGGVVAGIVAGAVVDRLGFRWPLTAVFLGLAAAMAAMSAAADGPTIVALSAVAGFCVMAGMFSLYALAPMFYPPAVRASGAGATVGVSRIGSIVGPLIAGQLRAAGASPGAVFAAMIPVALTAALALIALSFVGRTRDD
jgi:AAHS family 3-hydroxyphenylpropionic acid transporter